MEVVPKGIKMKNPPIELRYSEHEISDVLNYFAKGFKFSAGEKLRDYSFFYDPNKGVVVFKLVIGKGKK